MGKKNKDRYAPSYAYEDNARSTFGMIYDDLKTSKYYQALKPVERLFLDDCYCQASTKMCKECLYKALETRYKELGEERTQQEIANEVYNNGMFVFPKEHLKRYGYTSQYASKLFNGLIAHGFIEKVQFGKHAWKVNIYQFSTRWKNNSR